ncbi:TonB-dependent receptor plug domain-containing protein [Flavobacteriaceae bacterium GSB9]|nr:TonB-dependent receptor plug domain-containing protein [Flavobacteriaceae bacterium GSB9]
MTHHSTKVKKGLLLCLICLLSTFNILSAQEKKSITDIEKIYVHTDRDYYVLGEDLWYKAYVVNAYSHQLFDYSNVLYVELISPESKILARNKTLIQEGLGHGDFKLNDSIGAKPGRYQLRAYTNYSRNFGDDFIFEKDFEIIDVYQQFKTEETDLNADQAKAAKTIEAKENQIDIQFFPEGGSLVHNVPSAVAFKATDSYGNPVEVKGEIYDSNNQLVSLFLGVHNGMGKFQLKPQLGSNYYAKITTSSGLTFEKQLPEVIETGYLLSYKKYQNRDIVSIRTNAKTMAEQGGQVSISCNTRGINYLEGTQQLNKTVLSFELPTQRFTEGISQITLYDSKGLPQSERLVYIEKSQDLQVELSTDKNEYVIGEHVHLNLKSQTKSGDGVLASFSLSVADTNGSNLTNDYSSNICSHFLLESDIRGKIIDPGYYFDKRNKQRLAHLDLLLLTQGWRNFLWKTMPKPSADRYYEVEKGFEITGNVKQLFGQKPKVGLNLTLALMGEKGMNILNAETDSLGHFKFDELMFVGKTNMFLNSRNDRGKFRGEIVMNPFETKPMPANFSVKDSIFLEPVTTSEKIIENVYRKYASFGIAAENVLDAVEITATKKRESTSLHGIADFTYEVDENSPVVNDIYQFIQLTIPGTIVTNDTVRFMRFSGPAHIILDGFPLFTQADLDFVLPENVERIEAIKGPSAAIYGAEGANGVIAIYTKEGTTNTTEKKVFHSIKKEIEGFYAERTFYTPNPEEPDFEKDNKAAVRNTIFWSPYVHPDATGTAKVSFKNTKVETQAKVTLEGITASGIPVVKHAFYSIKK